MPSGLPGAQLPAVTQGSLLPDGFLSDCLGPGSCHSEGCSKQGPKDSYIVYRTLIPAEAGVSEAQPV